MLPSPPVMSLAYATKQQMVGANAAKLKMIGHTIIASFNDRCLYSCNTGYASKLQMIGLNCCQAEKTRASATKLQMI